MHTDFDEVLDEFIDDQTEHTWPSWRQWLLSHTHLRPPVADLLDLAEDWVERAR
jgi:hypothetical protein